MSTARRVTAADTYRVASRRVDDVLGQIADGKATEDDLRAAMDELRKATETSAGRTWSRRVKPPRASAARGTVSMRWLARKLPVR